jgi:hypothetical protein
LAAGYCNADSTNDLCALWLGCIVRIHRELPLNFEAQQ